MNLIQSNKMRSTLTTREYESNYKVKVVGVISEFYDITTFLMSLQPVIPILHKILFDLLLYFTFIILYILLPKMQVLILPAGYKPELLQGFKCRKYQSKIYFKGKEN